MGRKRDSGNERLGEHLQRRAGGIIELRFPIPADVRHAFPGKTGKPRALFIQSMGTADVRLANDRADPIRSAIKAKIARYRAGGGEDELRAFLKRLYEFKTANVERQTEEAATEAHRRKIFGLEADDDAPEKVFPIGPGRLRAALAAYQSSGAAARSALGDDIINAESLMHGSPERRLAAAGWAADSYFLETTGSIPSSDNPEYVRVVNECVSVLLDAAAFRVQARRGEEITPPMHSALSEPKASPDGNQALKHEGRLKVRDYYDQVYEPALKSKRNRPGERSLPERAFGIQQFIELQGNKRLYEITRDDIWAFRDKLLKLPNKRGLKDGWREKSSGVVLRAVEGGLDLGPPMNPKTVNKRMSAISTMLRFAEESRHLKSNVSHGIRAEVTDEDETGRPFEVSELNRIFAQPLFTGSMVGLEPRGRLKPGPVVLKDDAYWIPIVLFLTGARSAEIVGLDVADVIAEGDVPHIIIEANAHRRIKNPQSRRMVPVHPYLVEAGFLEFVESRKSAGGRLFAAAEQTYTTDRRTGERVPKALSNTYLMRQFNRTILVNAGAAENHGSIKCFRNTFEEAAFNCIRDEEIRLRLTGRTIKNSSKVYKDRIPRDPAARVSRLRTLYDAISLITFDGVDISHIRGTPKS